MIQLLRIDERLIHGQVAVTWCSALGVDSIVVANDRAASDDISIMSLKMAAPSTVRVAVKSVADAVTLLNDQRAQKRNILLLVNHPKDALYLLERVAGIPTVNVGNFGMIATDEHRHMIATSLAVTKQEAQILAKICQLKPESHYQMTPTLTPQRLQDLLKEIKEQ